MGTSNGIVVITSDHQSSYHHQKKKAYKLCTLLDRESRIQLFGPLKTIVSQTKKNFFSGTIWPKTKKSRGTKLNNAIK
jgi:hypothetical protein